MSASPPLAFHACPPPGEWLNDPNGLLFDGHVYRMLAQHRADGPAFETTGWGCMESRDLLRWAWQGEAIAPDGGDDAWSGSLFSDQAGLLAWHTRHSQGAQDQVLRSSPDGGRSWSAPLTAMAPARSEWRDPFVFRFENEWRMLLAAPCPWKGGATERSRLELYRSPDGLGNWQKLQDIGPWAPPGIMWEVPLLVPDPAGPGLWSLILSSVDRRGDTAWCSVRRWRGSFDGSTFIRSVPEDDDGQHVDCGPDYYAAMANLAAGWPDPDQRTLVGWASNWQTGRRFGWPGFHGGPIALPRRLTASGSAPLPSIVSAFDRLVPTVPSAGMGVVDSDNGALHLEAEGAGCTLTVAIDADGQLDVARHGIDWLDWQARHPATLRAPRRLTIFVDGPLIEIHIAPDDRWVSCILPVSGSPFAFSAQEEGTERTVRWHILRPETCSD